MVVQDIPEKELQFTINGQLQIFAIIILKNANLVFYFNLSIFLPRFLCINKKAISFQIFWRWSFRKKIYWKSHKIMQFYMEDHFWLSQQPFFYKKALKHCYEMKTLELDSLNPDLLIWISTTFFIQSRWISH